MTRYLITYIALFSFVLLSGCAQYRCNDGTYVEDPYNCFNHGGIGYYSSTYKSKKRASKTLSGTWNIEGNLSSNSCPSLNNKISTPVRITQLSNGVITIRSLAGYGAATTKLRKNRVSFNVKRSNFLYSIQGSVNVGFATNNNSANLTASGTAKFLGGKTCDATIKAVAKKR